MRQYHITMLVGSAAVLLVSWLLAPDPRGYGTHEHLHMPPCTFHTVTHIRCPFCGMTTSFSYAMHGELGKAFVAHPAGPLFVLIVALQIPYRLLLLVGKRPLFADKPRASERVWQALLVLAILGWLIRLALTSY